MKLKYAIVTPVRDEEEYITRLIESVIKQTVLPLEFLIIDDGSTDSTPKIIESYAKKHPWIRIITLPNRGHRLPGGETAIQKGFSETPWDKIDILARLDADISFGETYFETLLSKFEQEPKLGITSGAPFELKNGNWVKMRNPDYHTRGASKLYLKACYNQIKPIGTWVGWDGQDDARANYYGWITKNYYEAPFFYHRYVGGSIGLLKSRRNDGIGAYYIGYHPLFIIVRSLTYLFKKPYILGSVMMITGWLEGYLKKLPREEKVEVIEFVRQQQLNRLLGKPTVWK